MSSDRLDPVLAATDLEQLSEAHAALPPGPDDSGRAATVIDAWADVQAVANLLMYPTVLPDAVRTDALLRGLREDGYLRLAAAVGVGDLSPTELVDDVRRELLDALLDVVASDAGPAGIRASAEVGPLIRSEELELLDDLAAHPVEAVRHNLTQAALGLTAPDEREPVLLPYLPDYAAYVAGA
ncbi:hypothetical protein GCM10009795_017550 [Nocardioides hankookensis]|uniref:DUF222 domain-containing protein n=1 Tax=Nocardioides hankookensis TaxID=443157 RepID=A0ABW1LKE1_9ACTN